jgi:hypothetical protein
LKTLRVGRRTAKNQHTNGLRIGHPLDYSGRWWPRFESCLCGVFSRTLQGQR